MAPEHVPVLADETVGYLAPERGGTFVDCTLGLGGHAVRLLERAPGIRLVGIDRDPEALAIARERLRPWGDRVELVESNFGDLAEIVARLGLEPLAGVLADLGVSSLQLDTAERGFSFRRPGPLDMRMEGVGGRGGETARDVVNEYGEDELTRLLREYGEEPQARRVARAIVQRRTAKPIETTGELREVVEAAKGGPRQPWHAEKIDPATRVFQALRIQVNQELAGLERLLDQVVDLLDRDGRLVVISYHSLEDRLVKRKLRDDARGDVDLVTGRPRAETQLLEVLTRKPVRPSEAEVAANPRSRSARLRAARRL